MIQISKPKGWDTLLSMVWKDFERSIKKTSDSKFIQKGKITQQTSQTSSRKTAKNQADTLKTNDGQPPSSLEDKASKNDSIKLLTIVSLLRTTERRAHPPTSH